MGMAPSPSNEETSVREPKKVRIEKISSKIMEDPLRKVAKVFTLEGYAYIVKASRTRGRRSVQCMGKVHYD